MLRPRPLVAGRDHRDPSRLADQAGVRPARDAGKIEHGGRRLRTLLAFILVASCLWYARQSVGVARAEDKAPRKLLGPRTKPPGWMFLDGEGPFEQERKSCDFSPRKETRVPDDALPNEFVVDVHDRDYVSRAFAVLEDQGMVVLRNVVSKEETARIRSQLIEAEGWKMKENPSWPMDRLLRDPGGRYDLYLSLEADYVREALNLFVSRMKGIFDRILGPGGSLTELSCMTTCESTAQTRHWDSSDGYSRRNNYPRGRCAVVYSSYLALQDTDEKMGATVAYPTRWNVPDHLAGTDVPEEYATYVRNMQNEAVEGNSTAVPLRAGDVFLYSWRMAHRAGANVTGFARMMLYFTFMSEGVAGGVGATYSVLSKSMQEGMELTSPLLGECMNDIRLPKAIKEDDMSYLRRVDGRIKIRHNAAEDPLATQAKLLTFAAVGKFKVRDFPLSPEGVRSKLAEPLRWYARDNPSMQRLELASGEISDHLKNFTLALREETSDDYSYVLDALNTEEHYLDGDIDEDKL